MTVSQFTKLVWATMVINNILSNFFFTYLWRRDAENKSDDKKLLKKEKEKNLDQSTRHGVYSALFDPAWRTSMLSTVDLLGTKQNLEVNR